MSPTPEGGGNFGLACLYSAPAQAGLGIRRVVGFRRCGAVPRQLQALLAEHGPARLRLAGPESSLVPVLHALRETHGLSLAQAREMADELRTTGLVGTLVEMEHVAAGLRRRSVAATVESAAD